MFFFLPLGTTRPRLRVPYVTFTLIGLNVMVFFATAGLEHPWAWGFVPAHPSPLTWLASLFLHVGLLHVLGNMLFLWLFGSLVEDALGPRLFLAFYFGGAVGATALDVLMSAVFVPDALAVPRVGASGAIAGIMGLAAVCFLRARVRVWYFVWFYIVFMRTGTVEIPAPAFVALWVIWEIVQGLVSTYTQAALGAVPGGVAHWAHVGGFAMGLAGALVLHLRTRVVHGDLVSGRGGPADLFTSYERAGELKQLVERSPDDADGWYALGRAWEVCGQGGRAGEAYRRAMRLFLGQHRGQEAARAYQALKSYGGPGLGPDRLSFDLACALEEAGHAEDAFEVFRAAAGPRPSGPLAETALARAAEVAFSGMGDAEKASECYQSLLSNYPNSRWEALARQRLRELEQAADTQGIVYGRHRPGR